MTECFAYIVEVVESARVLSQDTQDIVEYRVRKVVGIFRDRDRAEKCRRLQPEFVEDPHGLEPQVIIREIDSDF